MKKNKKEAPEQVTPKKDYQQEVDPDVKGSEKSKKLLIGIVAFIVVFFTAILGWYINDNSVKEQKYDVDGKTAAPVIAQGEESKDEVIDVDGSLLDLTKETVEIKIPLEFYQDEKISDTLSEAQKTSGYLDVKKDNTSVTYTIKTSFYPSIVENLYDFYCQEGDKFEKKNGVELVSCNKYMDNFTITVAKSGYKANSNYDMLESLYYYAAIYRCYLGASEQSISVNFQMKYLHEDFPFMDYLFPQCLGKDLGAIAAANEAATQISAPNDAENV